jgi:hypothetical protein
MESLNFSRDSLRRTEQWQSLVGEFVEVRLDRDVYRTGWVDAAMPDASIIWIAPDGASQRELIDSASGFEVWTTASPRPGWAQDASSEREKDAAEKRKLQRIQRDDKLSG